MEAVQLSWKEYNKHWEINNPQMITLGNLH